MCVCCQVFTNQTQRMKRRTRVRGYTVIALTHHCHFYHVPTWINKTRGTCEFVNCFTGNTWDLALNRRPVNFWPSFVVDILVRKIVGWKFAALVPRSSLPLAFMWMRKYGCLISPDEYEMTFYIKKKNVRIQTEFKIRRVIWIFQHWYTRIYTRFILLRVCRYSLFISFADEVRNIK